MPYSTDLDNNASVPNCGLPAIHIRNVSGKFVRTVGDYFNTEDLLCSIVVQ